MALGLGPEPAVLPAARMEIQTSGVQSGCLHPR